MAEETTISPVELIDKYVDQTDWRVQENSNIGYSYASLLSHVSGHVVAAYVLDKYYPSHIAKAHREGDFHLHDLSSGIVGYCAGWSLQKLLQMGFVGNQGRASAAPAKHLDAALGQTVNFLCTLQTEWAGAQAFSSFDTLMAPFVRRDKLSYKRVEQAIQQFVYMLNIASRWGQTPFTNLTLDWTVPEDLQDQPVVIGGEFQEGDCYGDYQKEMDIVNKAFLNVMDGGDRDGRIFTFPIPTYNITKDFNWSGENARLLFKVTGKYGLPYFQNFVNSHLNPGDVRSMCPLTPDTEVMVRSSRGIKKRPIGEVYSRMIQRDVKYEAWTPSGWMPAHPVRTPATKVYRIVLSNGTELKMGEDHLQPTRDSGTLSAKDLQVGMWLPANATPVEGADLSDKEYGFAVGAFIGDGSHDSHSVVYSLNAETDSDAAERLRRFWSGQMGFKISEWTREKLLMLRVNGSPNQLIRRFVAGTDALNKKLKQSIYDMSISFKEGVVAGLRATDGAKEKRRYYTASGNLLDDLVTFLACLGRKAMKTSSDEREDRFGENSVYCLDMPLRARYGNYFDEKNGFHYYRIETIEEIPYTGEWLYCLEVDEESHLFMLANGVVTHNCRLQMDLTQLESKTGGLFGSGEQTGSIGVVTMNMPRIGYLAEDESDFLGRLDTLLFMARDSLEIKREKVQENLDRGLMPYTKIYLQTLDNHFCTIGLVGMHEACRNFMGGGIESGEGHEFTLRVLDHMRDRMVEFQKETGHLYNLEATPAEGTSYRLARIDRKHFPDIITSGSEVPYYTNSTQLPVGFTTDIFEAFDLQDELQAKYTGGTVLHGFVGERIEDPEQVARLVKTLATRYKLPYFTITPTFSICPEHGYISGEHETCPYC